MTAILLKLKYCPVCGSAIERHFGQGLLYQAITWICSNRRCRMSQEFRPLDGWNVANRPNLQARIRTLYGAVCWWYKIRKLERTE